MNILVASDLTARSDAALRRAVALSRELDARLRVVHVVDEGLPEAYRDSSMEWAERSLAETLEGIAAGVQADVEVIAGTPRDDIARLADQRQADLIVLGRHSATGERSRRFADTSAGGILKSTFRAVLIACHEPREGYRRAVVGVDFSMFSIAAVRQAAELAPDSELHLVHAYHVPFSGFLGNAQSNEEVAYDARLELDAFLRDEMEQLQSRAAGVRPAIRTHLEEGPATEVLRSTCERVGADLVVIGTHSRAGLSRAIWGSVATNLLDDPPCDLLVVKPFGASQRDR